MNIDVEKFAIGCFRNWNTSWTGSVLFQMPIENANQKTYQVGNKNDTIGKWLNLSSSGKENGHSISIK